MRVTFRRIPDHERGYAVVARDDGVTYRMDGGYITADLPHDLVHFTVERALGIADGIWGAVAAGVVFKSMRHDAGRRPPHAADRSAALIRANRDRLQRAELIGGLVEMIAELPDPTPEAVARVSRRHLATLPPGELDLADLTRAADELREQARRWRALAIGEELTVEWPARLRLPAAPVAQAARRAAPRRQAAGRR